METNNKKSIFTKKNIIIGVSILIIFILLIYFLFLKGPKEKVVSCVMSIDNYSYADINIDMVVYYTDKVNKMEGKINFVVVDDTLKTKINDLEEQLTNYYKKSVNEDSIKINVSRENYTINIDYSIDYNKIKDEDIESFDLFLTEDMSKRMTIDEFKSKILNSGGSCVEE